MTTIDPRHDWQRTSPIAVVFYVTKFAHQVISNGLPAIAGLAAAAAAGGDRSWHWLLPGLLVVVTLGLIGAVLSYLRFRFRIIDDRILVRSGVLHHDELDIAFHRVQNITIREPFYMRPFGLALLSVDTAGSGKKEVVLGGIARTLAQTLRETILATNRLQESVDIDAPVQAEGPRLLLTRSPRDIVIYGLTINFLLWVAIFVGAMFGAYDFSEQFVAWLADRINFEALWTASQSEGGAIAGLLIGFALFIAVLVILPLIGVTGALIRHHGYRLTADGTTYRKHSGLLSHHDESLKRHKIQAVVWKQNFMACALGRINMQLRVASAGSGADSGQLPTGPKASFLVPALHRAEAIDLVAEFLPGCHADQVVFSSIDRRRFVSKTVAMRGLPPIAGLSIVPMILVSWMFALAALVALGLAYLIINQQGKKFGYCVVGEYGFVRTGFIGTQTTLFPLFKVQRVDIRQTPGQRRHGLANLTIHLASHSLAVPYMRLLDAERIRDLALYYVESSSRPWY